jgi:hypothetical protein
VIRALLVVIVVLSALLGLQTYRLGASKLAQAKAETVQVASQRVAEQAARKAEQAHAQALADIAEQYERDKTSAESNHARLVADLRAGIVRLHDRWQAAIATSKLSGTVARAAESDAAARDREESAARIIAAADQCDAQVRGLQEVIVADRR